MNISPGPPIKDLLEEEVGNNEELYISFALES
jgi:hypothetical protein